MSSVSVLNVKPEVQSELENLAASIVVKLREAGSRVVSIGLDLYKAKRLLGPGKGFEMWVSGRLGLSIATAYRWIQAAEGFKTLRLDERPDLLDETDVAEILSVSFPQGFRNRIASRVKALDEAEAVGKEAEETVKAEVRKLAKATDALKEAEAEFTKAQAKADKITEEPSGVVDVAKTKVLRIRTALDAAKTEAARVKAEAMTKVQNAKAQAKAAREGVSKAQAEAEAAKVQTEAAKADVQTEAKASIQGVKAKAKAEADTKAQARTEASNKAQGWEVFLSQWMNTLEAKIKETFPVERQAEAFKIIGNMLLAKAQTLKVAKAA